MKYLKQLAIILFFSFLGELLNRLIPLPIPESIYGMLLMFIALLTKMIKLEEVEETSEFLLSIMLLFFVPASVSIMDTFFVYKSSMPAIILIVIASTIVVLITTSGVTELIIKFKKKGENENE